jgi:CRP/FNR family transcriptional regulator
MLDFKLPPLDCTHRRETGDCSFCAARPFSVCASIPDADLERLNMLAERISLTADQPLFHEGDQADHVFNVTSGSVRLYQLMPDGRRHVAGFLFAGDFLGLAEGADYAWTAEAMEPATLCRFRKADYAALMAERRELESALLTRAGHELAAAQARMLLLGRKTAIERVASFLLGLPASDPMRPIEPGQVRLPMTRGEIADYLGLTLETVSRCLGRLKRSGLVRQISLNDFRLERPEALREVAEGEGV